MSEKPHDLAYGDGTCQNCLQWGLLMRVEGYWACEPCYISSQLPPHLR